MRRPGGAGPRPPARACRRPAASWQDGAALFPFVGGRGHRTPGPNIRDVENRPSCATSRSSVPARRDSLPPSDSARRSARRHRSTSSTGCPSLRPDPQRRRARSSGDQERRAGIGETVRFAGDVAVGGDVSIARTARSVRRGRAGDGRARRRTARRPDGRDIPLRTVPAGEPRPWRWASARAVHDRAVRGPAMCRTRFDPRTERGCNGRGDRIRTYDPWTPRPVRYQTAPRPDTLQGDAPSGRAPCYQGKNIPAEGDDRALAASARRFAGFEQPPGSGEPGGVPSRLTPHPTAHPLCLSAFTAAIVPATWPAGFRSDRT